MIITRISGGLGNQMAQYAFGSIVAKKLKTDLYLDTSWYQTQNGSDDRREFVLKYFNSNLRVASGLQIYDLKKYYRFPFYLLPSPIQQAIHSHSRSVCVKEIFPNLISIQSLSNRKNYYFDGYWLNLAYFQPHERFIQRLFPFQKPVLSVQKVIDSILNDDVPVSLHIRRGDYVTNPKANAIFGVLPISYYAAAISYLTDLYKHPVFYVFSNDLPWAKKHLPKGYSYHFVHHDSSDMEDMRLMSLCAHNIVANSTFSWWGAWLNQHAHKKVIAPKHWYKAALSTEGLIPQSWIQL